MHDPIYKRLFDSPDMVRDLLRAVADADWLGDVDLGTLEQLSAEHVGDHAQTRRGDAAWRVLFRNGWLYTLASHMAEMNPDSDAVQAYLALQLIAAGHDKEALAAALRARYVAQRSRGASLAQANTVLGRVLLERARPADAEASFRDALAAGPPKRMVPGIHRGIATALVRQARYAEGISAYRELVHKDPTHDHAHAELGEALQTLGDYGGAADAFRRALDGYAMLTSFVAFFDEHRWLALLIGIALGGIANFTLATRYVFGERGAASDMLRVDDP